MKEDNQAAKFYPLFEMVIRLLTGVIVASTEFYNPIASLILFFFLQTFHLSILLMVRPYNQKSLSIFSFVTESYVLFIIGMLIIFSDDDDWNESVEDSLASLIFLNCMFISFFFFGKGLIALILYFNKKRAETKVPVAPDNSDKDPKPIEKIPTFRNITHLTTLELDNSRRNKYEESKTEITIDDMTKYKGKDQQITENK